jgi:hypothetical protein
VAEERPPVYSETAMERSRWTDERLDDFAGAIGNRFDRVDREFDRIHQDIRELRQWIFRLTIGMSLGFISVLSAILVYGA